MSKKQQGLGELELEVLKAIWQEPGRTVQEVAEDLGKRRGSARTTVLTVFLIEVLARSGRVKDDAAIGLVFPALFSAGGAGAAPTSARSSATCSLASGAEPTISRNGSAGPGTRRRCPRAG